LHKKNTIRGSFLIIRKILNYDAIFTSLRDNNIFKSIKNNSKSALMDYGVQINICTFEAH